MGDFINMGFDMFFCRKKVGFPNKCLYLYHFLSLNKSLTTHRKMSAPSLQSPFSLYVNWRFQASPSYLCMLIIYPELASSLFLMSQVMLVGLPLDIRFSVGTKKLLFQQWMQKQHYCFRLCSKSLYAVKLKKKNRFMTGEQIYDWQCCGNGFLWWHKALLCCTRMLTSLADSEFGAGAHGWRGKCKASEMLTDI